MINRDLVLKVGYTSAILESPLSIYIYDRNIMLNVEVINYDFRFGGDFSNIIGKSGIVKAKTYLRSPKGQIFTYPDVETNIENDKVHILIKDIMTDEESEIGEYTVQIQVFDTDGSTMHIHPFKFYVHDLIARTGNIDFDAGDNAEPYESINNENVITSEFLNDLEQKLFYSYSDNLYKKDEISGYRTTSKTTVGAINELKKLYIELYDTFNKLTSGKLDIGKYKEENNLTVEKGDKDYKPELDVNNKLTKIEVINKQYNNIASGSYYLYKCNTTPSTVNIYEAVKWSSSNPEIAKVNSTGKVTGIKPGFAIITAYSVYDPKIYEQFRVNII